MFMDSVHPQHNTVCSKVWIEKGTQRWIESNTGRQRVNINGVYNPFDQKIITQQDSTINAEVTKNYYKKSVIKILNSTKYISFLIMPDIINVKIFKHF